MAEILHRLVPLASVLGITTTWDVIGGSPEFFEVTDRFGIDRKRPLVRQCAPLSQVLSYFFPQEMSSVCDLPQFEAAFSLRTIAHAGVVDMGRTGSSMRWNTWRLNHRLLGLLVGLAVSETSLGTADVYRSVTDKVPEKLLFQDGRLTARITRTPLRQVMDEISRLSGAQVHWLGPGAEEAVTVQFANTPLPRALKLILGEKNFLLLYSSAKNDAKLTQIWISPAGRGNGQVPLAPLARVSASTLWGLQRTALRGQNLWIRFQAVEQLKGYAQTDTRAKAALSRVARGANDLKIRQAAARALAGMR